VVVPTVVVVDQPRAIRAGDPLGATVARHHKDRVDRARPAERYQHVGEHRLG
jgi:hypothetical protein